MESETRSNTYSQVQIHSVCTDFDYIKLIFFLSRWNFICSISYFCQEPLNSHTNNLLLLFYSFVIYARLAENRLSFSVIRCRQCFVVKHRKITEISIVVAVHRPVSSHNIDSRLQLSFEIWYHPHNIKYTNVVIESDRNSEGSMSSTAPGTCRRYQIYLQGSTLFHFFSLGISHGLSLSHVLPSFMYCEIL